MINHYVVKGNKLKFIGEFQPEENKIEQNISNLEDSFSIKSGCIKTTYFKNQKGFYDTKTTIEW